MTSPEPTGDAVMVYLTDSAGRILLVRKRWRLRQHWMPPGGHIETHESPKDAACRELQEEVSLRCAPDDLNELGCCSKDVGTGGLILFASRRYEGRVTLGDELVDARWIDPLASVHLSLLPATAFGIELLGKQR